MADLILNRVTEGGLVVTCVVAVPRVVRSFLLSFMRLIPLLLGRSRDLFVLKALLTRDLSSLLVDSN